MPSVLKRNNRVKVIVFNVYRCLMKDLYLDTEDVNYILKRYSREGFSFLSKVLPLFSKYALKCVSEQRIIDARTQGLTNFELKGRSPAFMAGFLKKAVEGDPHALLVIRQVCDYFYKAALSFTDEQLSHAWHKYKAVEHEIRSRETTEHDKERARKAFETLFPKLSSLHLDDFLSGGLKDGPGAFYGSEYLHMPFEVYKKLPHTTIGSHPRFLDHYRGYFRSYPNCKAPLVPKTVGRTCSIVFVPKDSRGPRTISKEPLLTQRVQLAAMTTMCRYLHSESKGRINFSSQDVNRELARKSSVDRKHATVDLKEASDRVDRVDVRHVVRNSPGLRLLVRDVISTHCERTIRGPNSPKKEIIPLRKFANMGAGMCFPVLSLVVYLAAVIGVQDWLRKSLTFCALQVYVYGDDLCIPTQSYDYVVRALNRYGLLVNDDKSFVKGHFRESCGGDYYHGVNVTPVRFRMTNASFESRQSPGSLQFRSLLGEIQLERHCRELRIAHLDTLAEYYYSVLEKRFGELPAIAFSCSALGRAVEKPPVVSVQAYVPHAITVRSDHVCQYKLLSEALKPREFIQMNPLPLGWDHFLSDEELALVRERMWTFASGYDPYRGISLRHKVGITRQTVSESVRVGYGLP